MCEIEHWRRANGALSELVTLERKRRREAVLLMDDYMWSGVG